MDDATLFRRAFGVALILGVLSRLIVLRIVNKQQPTQPQDYIEQLILSF
ncbi:YIEGIA domain-containing protein, partial [Paraclostridium bifermentans]